MTAASAGPAFSVHDIPFSTHGSWFDISPVVAEKTYAEDLHLVSHQNGMHAVLRLVPLDAAADGRAGTSVRATPGLLSWIHRDGRIDLVYESPDTVRLRGAGLGLRVAAAAQTLTPFSGTYFFREAVGGGYVFTSYETGRRYRITLLSGTVSDVSGAEALGSGDRGVTVTAENGGTWEIAVEEYEAGRRPYASSSTFGKIAEAARNSFADFVDAVAPWRSSATPAAELAAYVVWSATVRPAGLVTRPAVLMSKHWMDKVWSWDHCFNSLALAPGCPELAWDQFALPFDHQDESGALPDSVTHSEVLHNFVKPPIHGWALRRLRHRLAEPLPQAELAKTYDRLERWTDFWLTARRAPVPPCLTTSTATTAAGTTPRPSTPSEWSSRPTWLPSSSSSFTNSPFWQPSWGAWTTPTDGRTRPTRSRPPCSTSSGPATGSSPVGSPARTPGAAPACST